MYYKKLDIKDGDPAGESNLELLRLNYKWAELAARIDVLEKRGILESCETGLPTKNGQPQPLLTFSFMDYFETHDFSEYQFIEFGSGNSTLYFAKFCKKVCSFEQNFNWYNQLKTKLPNNVEYTYLNDYHPLPKVRHDPLNVTLVDFAGIRFRAVKQLIDEGETDLLILDNSDVSPNSTKLLLESGYKEITFWGGKLTEHYESCTSLFFKNVDVLPKRNFRKQLLTTRNVIGNLYDKP